MTKRDFQQYLDHPQSLLQLQLPELQSIALKYPYSPNIRLLLLLKTHLEGHPDEQVYLSRCAAASFDRAHLYELLRELDATMPEDLLEESEILELRELDDLHRQLQEKNSLAAAIPLPSSLNEMAEDASHKEQEAFLEEEIVEGPFTSISEGAGKPSEANKLTEFAVETWVSVASTYLSVLPDFNALDQHKKVFPGPEAPENFSGYLAPRQSPGLIDRLQRIRNQQALKKSPGRDSVNRIARRSLVTQDDVASETLARLLVQQKQYQNAIKMYRRLILLYPDKKTIFAGLIKDLKEKL